MSFTIFGVFVSMGIEDFIGILVALGLAVYLVYCLIRPGEL
jgi:K+-transporting ATPase KdpF subunit